MPFPHPSWKFSQTALRELERYVSHGCLPGSFTISLLLGDSVTAEILAHEGIRELDSASGQAIWENHFQFVQEFLPEICRGTRANISKWSQHNGLAGAHDGVKVLFRLSNCGIFD